MKQTLESTTVFDCLKSLIDYPTQDNHQRLQDACQRIRREFPFAEEPLERFLAEASSRTPEAMEEEYIRVFDFNPDCALEIGWHLYGENYGRGDFLVKMRDLLKHCNIREGVELPDHLTYVLQAFSHLEAHQAKEFCQSYILPGLAKLLPNIEKKETPYQIPLTLIRQILEKKYVARGETDHE